MNYKEILQNEEVKAYLEKGNENLGILGYTDHSEKHCAIVAKRAGMILSKFGYTEHEIELAEIAGAMHDIGNVINRKNHGEYGAILACSILEKLKMPLRDRILVMSAIGNHDESTGEAIDAISAALILADKTDVRRNRVRNKEKASFDKHDRVNYAVTSAAVKVNAQNGLFVRPFPHDHTRAHAALLHGQPLQLRNAQKHLIALNLQIDEEICTMYEYFEIFFGRMMMCRKAAEVLGARFKLTANGSKVL